MLYQEYKQKLIKILDIFEIVWRFRFLILIAFICLIALICTLVGITGNIYAQSCTETVVYGSEIGFEAKAIFREVTVKYRVKGKQDWSQEIPTFVGEYEVCAVAQNAFGKEKYGQTFSFIIVPLETELSFLENKIEYGDTPTVNAQLAYDDEIAGVQFSKEKIEGHIVEYTASVTVEGVNGEDVTACYFFTKCNAEIEIIPRDVEITIEDATKVYDGTPLSSDNYEITSGSVLESDELTLTFTDSIIYVGMIKNTPEYSVTNSVGEDITYCYNLSFIGGELAVQPRDVEITIEDVTKVYDGTPLSSDDYEITSGSVLESDELTLTFTDSIIYVGTIKNTPEYSVTNSVGEDITYCYNLSFIGGELAITPKSVTVITGSDTWIYDGESHCCSEYDIFGVLPGDRYQVEFLTYVTDVTDSDTEVGYQKNKITFVFFNSDDKDITNSYTVQAEYGNLRIKTEIIITMYSVSKFYDGKPIAFEADDYIIKKPPDVLVRVDLSEFTLTTVGTISLDEIALQHIVDIYDVVTGDDVSIENRYRFEGNEILLQVKPRVIEITSASITKVKDGSERLLGTDSENSYWISKGALVDGHGIEVDVTGVLNANESGPVYNTIDTEKTKIYDKNGIDVTYCYEINYVFGMLQWI